jgi:hypothetical protein
MFKKHQLEPIKLLIHPIRTPSCLFGIQEKEHSDEHLLFTWINFDKGISYLISVQMREKNTFHMIYYCSSRASSYSPTALEAPGGT